MPDSPENVGFPDLKRSEDRQLVHDGTTTQELALHDGVLADRSQLPVPTEIRVWRLGDMRMPKNIFHTRIGHR